VGLGLSLVHAVAKLHGSALELFDRTPGLRVALTFPAVDALSASRSTPRPETEAQGVIVPTLVSP
jgi:hypothetical protein